MFNTLEDRENFVKKLKNYLEDNTSLSDVQVFVFGSFLTEEFTKDSDIDIGVYSKDEVKMYDIKYILDKYLDEINLKHDIVLMHLSDKLLINIPIVCYGKKLTDYSDTILDDYIVNMVRKYGFTSTIR